ncbi:hypothetical protein EMIHUDRAFT_209479 [Emiliania huxleyi CCMP1516]|uniref:Uncharacterized protein n=2 Tax=Emiliania huxleyi TaxID=2903 RepID=A0A0D3J5S3_EMIH1|nr:hypothetical protein EMIHUDRAFT_209479 [Emiliania huxleyi CCMP1516]EOD18858.1 hypothetical protein EMIHUDRAFT_209479 [Emiliania huxleyi CCMP1516]|eukprot:XP_005771287.1 hypothetical protein EMIHUDRAFT_209479 [Emiliania huxleyi CCMP1516]
MENKKREPRPSKPFPCPKKQLGLPVEAAVAPFEPAMVFGLTPSLYVKAGSFIFGAYGVQMLLVPSNMMTDHFEAHICAPATKYTDFWIRGQSVSIATVVYCMTKLPEDVAAKALLGLSAGIAVLYPFNAKFGYLSSLEVKYPMHYVPEALMLGLTVAGVLALK